MTALLDIPPPTWVPDRILFPRLRKLLDCLCLALAERHTPEPCLCAVMPGSMVATDYCSPCSDTQCGMAWTRLDSIFPSSVFPAQDVTAVGMGCSAMLAFVVECGVVRCVPVGDSHGNPPTKDQWEQASYLQCSDAMAIREAVKCCFGREKTMFGSYQPIGPEGGCVGGMWTVAVGPQGGGMLPPDSDYGIDPMTPSI